MQIERVRKVRDGKIVICCGNKEDLKKTEDQLKNTDGLKFEPAASRDPRVVIRNVFSYNSEKDIVESLKVQNKRLWLDMDPSHFRVKEAYRKKARNPHQAHVILQVSPQANLQRGRLATQEPLIPPVSRMLIIGVWRICSPKLWLGCSSPLI
ncbi:hypothetical protein HW555_008194 [Spodoptera exigua]|uniref:Uncharacterized protein n=1 Tax=Spodoptera exigua TaxID=7107 RepID=A0A835L828_SPOEX|nr:hypothetical protein HW555_008194 [Spodoptera exigua]